MPRRVRLCKGWATFVRTGSGYKYLVAGASVSVCDVLACTSESRRALKIYHPSHTHPVSAIARALTHEEVLYTRAQRMRDDRGSRLGRGRG